MTAINATPDPVTGAPAIQDVWSVGDYDRLASYGSAPEAALPTGMRASGRLTK
jgi:hypothetical protein